MTDYKKLCEELHNLLKIAPGFGKTLTDSADAIEQIQGQCRTWETNANHWNTEYRKLQAENDRLKLELSSMTAIAEQNETMLDTTQLENERLKKQLDAAVAELEKYMVQEVIEGNLPCEICFKASAAPCEECDPQWRGMEDAE